MWRKHIFDRYQLLSSLTLQTWTQKLSVWWVSSGPMWQDKYDLLDKEGGDLVLWGNKQTKWGFPKSQRVGVWCQMHKGKCTAVPQISVELLMVVISNNPKKDPEDNHGEVGWSNAGWGAALNLVQIFLSWCFFQSLLGLDYLSVVGPISQDHLFLPCSNCPKKIWAHKTLN